MRIKKSDFETIFISILTAHIIFISLSWYLFPGYTKIRIVMAGFLVVFFFSNARKVFSKQYILGDIIIGIYVIAMLYSHYINRNIVTSDFVLSLFYVLRIVIVAPYVQYLTINKKTSLGLLSIQNCLLFYCIMNDIFMFIMPNIFWGGDYFLLGNKFYVAYLHVYFLAFYCNTKCINGNINNKKIWLVAIWTACISAYVQCTTGIVATIIFMIIYINRNRMLSERFRALKIIILLLVCDGFLILCSFITDTPLVSYIIEDILHESTDLSGRTIIYENAGYALSVNPLWGVGNDNNDYISRIFSSASNLQNGLLDNILSFGIIGTVLLCILLVIYMQMSKKKNNDGFLIFIIVWIIISMVEVSLRSEFFAFLVLTGVSEHYSKIKDKISIKI